MATPNDSQDRYIEESKRAAEQILENDLYRRNWGVGIRDALAERLRAFADKRHARLTHSLKNKGK